MSRCGPRRQLGPLADIAPTGKRMEVSSVLIFDGDHAICEKLYLDRATILKQPGMS
jgi:hypothetical protein